MEKLKQFMLILFASFCIMLATNNADARVCFAGGGDSDDCGSMNSFGDYTDPSKETADECTKAGYTDSASDCKANTKKHISGICPYNGDYVKCCDNVYAYSLCLFPLINDGKCGNSYRCKCDSAKFPYSGKNICKNNSMFGGSNCLQIDDSDKNMSIHYEKCICDRAVFPYAQNSDCGINQIVNPTNPCKGSDNVTFYRNCKCPDSWSACAIMGPAIGARKCIIDGVTHFENCCVCPSEYKLNLNDPHAVSHEPCPCNASYRKVAVCEVGYKVVGGRCVEMTCGESIEELFRSKPSAYPNYGIYKGSALSKSILIVGDNTTGYWSHLDGKTVYSGAAFEKMITGGSDEILNVKNKCKDEIPTITMYDSSNYGNVNIFSTIIKTSTIFNRGSFSCTNCGLDVSSVFYTNYNSSGSVNLAYDAAHPNANNMYANLTGLEIKGVFNSKGYNYTIGSLGAVIDNVKSRTNVMFRGISNSKRMNFVGDRLSVQGVAAFEYANVKVGSTCIGCLASYSGGSSGTTFASNGKTGSVASNLALYDTSYYIYDGGKNNLLIMTVASMLGLESSNMNASIIFSDASYYSVSFVQLWHEDCGRNRGYPYVSRGGIVTSRNSPGCGWYENKTDDCSAQDRPDDIRCKVNGSNSISKVAGGGEVGDDCVWEPKGRCNRRSHFQFHK